MAGFLSGQRGFSLLELVVTVVIIGVAIPALTSLFGTLVEVGAHNEIRLRLAALSEAKMSEISAFRDHDHNWYETIGKFAGSEKLASGNIRETVITPFENWGRAGVEGFEVTVKSINPGTKLVYYMKTRFTVYQK